MNNTPASTLTLWPLVVYFGLLVVAIAGILALSYVLGERTRRGRATDEIFESGIVTIGEARFRIPAKFFLMAMFFVIFDLETVFLFAWAIAMKEVGWTGYIEAMVFVFVLLAALIYLWRVGALEWGPSTARTRQN